MPATPEVMQYWEFISIIAGLIVTLLTPVFWFIRSSNKRSKEMSDKLLEKINETSTQNYEHMRQDFSDFRHHFDQSIQSVYDSIRENDKELREHVTNHINEIKSFITEMEARIEAAREHNHKLEKNLINYQREAQETFVTHKELDRFIEMAKSRKKDAEDEANGCG